MLGYKITRIRYSKNKLTLELTDPQDPNKTQNMEITLEMMKDLPRAIVRIDKDTIWFSDNRLK